MEAKVLPLLAPDALAHAAAPQLAWLHATIQAWQTRHEERREAMLAERREQRGGGSGATPAASVPAALQLLVDEIPCVCSASCGDASLAAAHQRLESIVLRKPPLLPCIGQFLPRDWLAAKGWDPAYGARPLKRAIQKALLDPLSTDVLEGLYREGDMIEARVDKGKISLQTAVAKAA